MNDKNEIRRQMRITRKNFPPEARAAADAAIFKRFFDGFGNYGSYFIYNGFSSEARTDEIIRRLLCLGKRVYLPRVEGKDMVPVRYSGREEELKKGAFGIAEPQGAAFAGDIEVTVIPLLAVNPEGFRVGYGGGFYDRYLRGKNTQKVGMGYGFQIVRFDEEPFDVPLDAYVYESGTLTFDCKRG